MDHLQKIPKHLYLEMYKIYEATLIIYVQIYLDHKICIQARDSRAEKVLKT